MSTPLRPLREERLSELVAHLSGAPMDRSREAVSEAASRNSVWGDNLLNVADALVALGVSDG